ncbi:MAG: N-formylglutamate amidohydrolase [Sphingomonadaceae bacterium]
MSPFRLTGALDGRSAMLLASPHSGTHVPAAARATLRLPLPALRRIEDAHVGRLLALAARAGLPLIEATHARAVIDLNRAEDEHDPAMIAGPLGPFRRTERVQRGYGLFPRIAGPSLAIHDRPIPAAEARARIEVLHRPWHAAIAEGLAAARRRHGFALLLDVHSMPRLDLPRPAELVLGDRHGTSAAPGLVHWLANAFTRAGLRVALNEPYAGGHTLERHGRPALGVHAIQLEFDRTLYMDPATLVPHVGLATLAETIATILARLAIDLPGLLAKTGEAQAAE